MSSLHFGKRFCYALTGQVYPPLVTKALQIVEGIQKEETDQNGWPQGVQEPKYEVADDRSVIITAIDTRDKEQRVIEAKATYESGILLLQVLTEPSDNYLKDEDAIFEANRQEAQAPGKHMINMSV